MSAELVIAAVGAADLCLQLVYLCHNYTVHFN